MNSYAKEQTDGQTEIHKKDRSAKHVGLDCIEKTATKHDANFMRIVGFVLLTRTNKRITCELLG